jgi:2-oxoglutarate dehydrogenase E2 component (dihydrolipoamide succinyltransferase)
VARRFAAEMDVDISQVRGSGPAGRVTKSDIENYLASRSQAQDKPATKEPAPEQAATQPAAPAKPAAQPAAQPTPRPQAAAASTDGRSEERIKMSRRRRTIAARLVEAQQTAAILTTFNEIDMTAVMDMRKRRGEEFAKRFDVKLGFMSFFVKASIGALKAFPRLNAEIQGEEMVLKRYYDIGIAIGAEEGLVVPVLRNADRMTFAQVEKAIEEYSLKSREGSLTLEDLRGGTFSITNGGVFGSLLSTPILTPPQVGILGMHKIEKRPVAVDDQVVIRPMMYVALSYDHRIVDGREAVQFLVKIKQLLEEPESLLLEG